MSTSYGMITITDTTDLGQLSVYLTGSTVRQQVYDGNTNPVSYYPNWDRATGTPLVITPHVYFDGQARTLSSNNIEVSWQKNEGGNTYPLPVSPTTEQCPEIVSNKTLERPVNLATNSSGVTYTATITYYPVEGDRSVSVQAIATLDLTVSNNGTDGEDGAPGAPAKMLQLIGSGSHFSYTWNSTPSGTTTINLAVEKSSTVSGVHWYCDNTLIENNGIAYTGLNLAVTTSNIGDYSPSFHNNKSALFKIVETDASGNEITGGLEDYFTIYKLQDAQPGSSTYSAYLDNDQETVNEYNGEIDFTNATTIFHLDKGGANNLIANSGWTISISDSGNITYTVGKSDFNTLPAGNNNEITAVTAMTDNTAWIQFTAQNSNSSISDQIKRFTIVKNPNLVSHSLRLDSVISNRNTAAAPDGIYNPSQIVVDGLIRTGGGTDSYRVANAIEAVIHYKDNTTTTIYNSANNALTINLTDKTASGDNPATEIDYIETLLKYNNNVVDTQRITISRDGEDGEDGQPGTSPWNFMLSNQFDSISTDFSYNTSQEFVIKLPVKAAEGTTIKDIYYGGQTYPTISALTPFLNNIIPEYYLGDTKVTTTGQKIDNVRYTIPINKNIGATGSITLTLNYAENQSLTQTYTYKAQPEVLKPIRINLNPSPSDTFENQSGTITITPVVLSGTSEITTGISNRVWEVYTEVNNAMSWVQVTSTDTTDPIYLNNGNIVVTGVAVEGYLGLRFTASVTRSGVTESYTEYINLKDIDDPLQVTVHSTIGNQIINSQGIGVIYARVIRKGDNEDYDNIVPDDMLAIGQSVPTTSTASGKTGYFRIVTSGSPAVPTGEIQYYWRTSGSGTWSGPRNNTAQKYKYTWTFRDSSNNPYSKTDQSIAAIYYAMNHDTQFVYVDADVIDKKITAIVKVEI